MASEKKAEKKEYPNNGKGYSALGNLSGRLESLEFRESKKGKTWASYSIKTGKSTVKGVAFSAKLIPILEGFAEGDDISLFGKISSNIGKEEKVYTSFAAFSANDDMSPSEVTVAGEVIGTESTEYADYADIEITVDDEHPEFVRIRLSGEVDFNDFEEGSKIRVSCVPQGKFGEFTAVKTLPFMREGKGSTGSTGSKPSDRFKRSAPAPAAEEEEIPAKPKAKAKLTSEEFTDAF